MTSLQKPRKIKMRGSDGKMYPFLCKPKDDLRKDARLMEFNNMINRFLKKDAESSRRRLCKILFLDKVALANVLEDIRTYFVTPLNEECGLIEWVNNLRPLRDILLKSYKTKRIPVQVRDVLLSYLTALGLTTLSTRKFVSSLMKLALIPQRAIYSRMSSFQSKVLYDF